MKTKGSFIHKTGHPNGWPVFLVLRLIQGSGSDGAFRYVGGIAGGSEQDPVDGPGVIQVGLAVTPARLFAKAG